MTCDMGGLKTQKRLAAAVLKTGKGRIRLKDTKEVGEAITREDMRALIKKGLAVKIQKKGAARVSAVKRLAQKRKGRRSSRGSRKGKLGARLDRKQLWIKQTRGLRRLLADLREKELVEKSDYKRVYRMVKGNAFRNRKHLMFYLRENDLLKKAGQKTPQPMKAGGK